MRKRNSQTSVMTNHLGAMNLSSSTGRDPQQQHRHDLSAGAAALHLTA